MRSSEEGLLETAPKNTGLQIFNAHTGIGWAGGVPQTTKRSASLATSASCLSVRHHLAAWSVSLSRVGMAASTSARGAGPPADTATSAQISSAQSWVGGAESRRLEPPGASAFRSLKRQWTDIWKERCGFREVPRSRRLAGSGQGPAPNSSLASYPSL